MGLPTVLLAGSAVSAYGQYRSGKDAAANYRAQAQIAANEGEAQALNLERQAEADRFNARMAEQDAREVSFAAGLDEDKTRREGRQILAAQRAAMIQNGVAGTFTSDQIELQSMYELELDALNVRYGGILQSRSLQQEAQNLLESAEMAEYNAATARQIGASSALNLQRSARSARKTGTLGAAGALLGGYADYRKAKR
jgi:hypothetical protein